MKAIALFAALMAVSTASMDRLQNTIVVAQPAVSAVQSSTHHGLLRTDAAMLPKCFPNCPY